MQGVRAGSRHGEKEGKKGKHEMLWKHLGTLACCIWSGLVVP